MYTEEQQELLKKFDELSKKLGSRSNACKAVGVTQGVMSKIINNLYTGNIEKQFKKIEDYFAIKSEQEELYKRGNYVETSISENVYKCIRYCQIKGGLTAISGDAGIGKTQAIKKFKEMNEDKCIWITANPCVNTVKPILRELSKQLNVIAKTNDEMYIGICHRLSDGDVIIIDEAQHLSIKVIETLRGISDYFADRGHTIGIVFVGNQTTIDKFGGKKETAFEQIENRTIQKPVYHTKDIQKEDIKKLVPEITDEESIMFLLTVARGRQALRGALNVFTNAYDNNNYTYEGLVGMAKYMKINV